MKKLYQVLFAALAVVMVAGFSSCGSDIRKVGGVLLTDQADIDLAVQYVTEHVPADALVTKVNFVPGEDVGVTKYALYMRVYYYVGTGDMLNVMLAPLMKKGSKPHVENEREAGYDGNEIANGVKFAEIDFSKIAGYISSAGQMVLAADEEYEESLNFEGVSGYEMTFAGDPKNATAEFSIESKDFETSTDTRDDYYEFEFRVKNGKLISEDGLE